MSKTQTLDVVATVDPAAEHPVQIVFEGLPERVALEDVLDSARIKIADDTDPEEEQTTDTRPSETSHEARSAAGFSLLGVAGADDDDSGAIPEPFDQLATIAGAATGSTLSFGV